MDEILQFWFPNHYEYQSYWFDKSKDEYIKQRYTSLLEEMESFPMEYFLEKKNEEKIAWIILFDHVQFTEMKKMMREMKKFQRTT